MNLPRLIRTVRHLRAEQIVGQIKHRLRRPFDDPARARRWIAPPFEGCRWKPLAEFQPPITGGNSAASIRAGQFTFLNQTHNLGSPIDWRASALPKLWRYNLHYHDYLWLLTRDDAIALLDDWTARAPTEAWEAYPTSLRLMNWCMNFRDVPERLWPSVYRQSEWLSRHLETHLMANHLLENAAALAMVGSCFAGHAAQRWLDIGTKLLREQLDEQILPDGGHVERSSMYQARVVYVLRQLRNPGNEELSRMVSEKLDRATAALAMMCHPDRQIALLNDSAFNIYPIENADLPPGPFALNDTGYFGARTADGHYIICDAGPIGPGYQPGHAHGDIFSFELSYFGHRVIVDSGVYDY